MRFKTQITAVALLGLMLVSATSLAPQVYASEVTGNLSNSMGPTDHGSIAGTVTGGSPDTTQVASSGGGGGGNLGGVSFGGYGGGSGGYLANSYPGAPGTGGVTTYGATSDNPALNEYYSSRGSGEGSGLAYSSYPDVPYAGGQIGSAGNPNSLVASAGESGGGLGAAAAIVLVLVGLGAIGGAAYGLNYLYRSRA